MKTPFYIWIILASIAGTFLTSCEKPNIREDSELLTHLYDNSDDTLTIQNSKYILETYLYRDFFPGGPIPKKSPLIADIYLINTDSLPIFEHLDVLKLYIIHDQLIYISSPVEGVQPNVPDFKLNKISRDGPEWGPNIYVDIIIEIINNLTNNRYLLIAKDQYIEKVE